MTDCATTHWRQMIDVLKDQGETDSLAAMKHLNVSRVNGGLYVDHQMCGTELCFIFRHIFNVREVDGLLHSFAWEEPSTNTREGFIRAPFAKSGSEGHIDVFFG
jgi:hypothetical protein